MLRGRVFRAVRCPIFPGTSERSSFPIEASPFSSVSNHLVLLSPLTLRWVPVLDEFFLERRVSFTLEVEGNADHNVGGLKTDFDRPFPALWVRLSEKEKQIWLRHFIKPDQ